jgi:hypothetical protein
MTCAICTGNGCAACDYVGTIAPVAAWSYRRTSSAPVAPVARGLLAICRDGTASNGATGDDRWTFPRWVLCLSPDGVKPAARFRNGGPRGVHRPVTGKRPPEWMARAAAYARAVGGVSAEEGAAVAEWYRTHRTGAYLAA